MPSFSSFLRPRKERSLEASAGSLDHEKVQRRQSTRDFFKTLAKKPINTKDARENSMKKLQPLEMRSPRSPNYPSTPSDTNKPLPPPPATDTPQAAVADNPPNPVTKLARIISPIALPDLHKLFSGAPQFFARSEGHQTGAPHPTIAYPWNTEVEIRDLCDHIQIQNDAWGCVTAWPHIAVQVGRDTDATKEHKKKQTAHFLPRCRERPNMLCMQGIERGSVGYSAALELEVADAHHIPDETLDIAEHRTTFLSDKEGLRPLTDSTLIERLVAVSTTYHEDDQKHHRPTVELYTELFTQILYPPSRVTDRQDPYSLQVQIEALIDVLAAPHVWVDFGLVEWRIRLGQILWGPSPGSDAEDEIDVNNEIMQEAGNQKYWLLLQILLSCELLLRLDAISANIDHGNEALKPSEIHRFDKNATMSVRWSIILARQWLENIKIVRMDLEAITEEKKPTAGWLASLTGGAGIEPIIEDIDHLKFEGRNQVQQLAGLLHFARKLNWPNMESLTAKIATNKIKISDTAHNTPAAGTPLSISTQHSASYFSNRRPITRRALSQKTISALLHPAGWLSNSYLSGLILPGEGLSHFLISTLLENDEVAVSKVGDEANLYGGFIYSGQSFWSTACIVGRVLAAINGSRECMGWISSAIVPRGASEEWVDIDIEPVIESESEKQGNKPRIWHKTAIETDGNVLGGADSSSILPGDFVLPSDESVQRPFSVFFETLDLFSADDSETNSIEEESTSLTGTESRSRIKTYSAMMRFTLETEVEGKKEINIALTHDSHFVTAQPCIPSPYTDIIRTPTSPSFQMLGGSVVSPTGHCLHKAFTYARKSILDILYSSASTSFTSLLMQHDSPNPTLSSTHTTSSHIPKVLVIDCTDTASANGLTRPQSPPRHGGPKSFGSDLEMLGRALCAERGWNALVSRRGRGCIACAVREAGALGWRVILRVG